MDLSIYIKELLYKYNCVIIPGFGAFVLNYSPSKINPLTNSFSPPSNDILFNPSINRNDGLVADYISSRTNITYDEASVILKDSIEDLKIALNKGKKIYFKEIGYFTVNREGSYQFEADDKAIFFLASYGLSNFHSLAINREGIARKIEKKIKHKELEHKDRRVVTTVSWAAAASILLMAVFTWTALRTDIFSNVNFNYSGIYYSLLSSLRNNDVKKEIPVKTISVPSNKELKAEINNNNAVTVDSSEVTENESTKAEETTEVVQPQTKSITKYYIIGGCFSIEDNAVNFLNELKSKGYDAEIIGKTKTGLIRVSYNSFDNVNDATNELSNLRDKENPNVWLLTLSNEQ